MNWQQRRENFRKQLGSNSCVHPASVFDPLSARMAEDLGFELGMFAGSVASLTVLGNPDIMLVTLSEFSEQAYRINRACDLPLLVDADHGYGNALNVMRTIEELETSGVSGLSIEDTDLPQRFGSQGKSSLLSIEEGIGKMKAAVQARQDRNLVIAARTSAPRVTDTNDAIDRIKAYQETGVDALFVVGIKNRGQLEAIAKASRLPLILGACNSDLMDNELLASLGVRICLQGHQPIMSAIQSIYTTMSALRNGEQPGELSGMPDKILLSRLTREGNYKKWQREFLE